MDLYTAWVGAGVVLAILTVLLARRVWNEQALCSAGLVVLGGWYLLFGIGAGVSFQVLLPQMVGGLFFAALGLVGLRGSAVAVSVGWTLHGLWDLASPSFSEVGYMPGWTEPACLGYDFMLGGYFFARALSSREARSAGTPILEP